jgi:hypothetical protein
MRRPVSALEAAVAALEPIVEETWPVAALEPIVEEIEPVGMQPCLPLHCHRPQPVKDAVIRTCMYLLDF